MTNDETSKGGWVPNARPRLALNLFFFKNKTASGLSPEAVFLLENG